MTHVSSRAFRKAFSMVEILVALGIVAILMSLLLAVGNSLRQRSRATACLSNLSEIGRLIALRASEQKGYAGLAGDITLPPAAVGNLPTALDDNDQTRYAYLATPLAPWGPGFVHHIRPLPAVLAGIASSDRLDSLQSLIASDVTNPRGALSVFRCPAAEDLAGRRLPSEIIRQGSISYARLWPFDNDYAFNSTVFGFHFAPEHKTRRLRGRWDQSANAMLVAVGDRALSPTAGAAAWTVRVDAPANPVRLDALVRDDPSILPMSSIDLNRHGKRANFLITDGHAEAISHDRLGVYLLAR